MANEAPDPRAKAIADKLLGRGNDLANATSLLVGGASIGQRDDEGRPIEGTTSKVNQPRKPRREAVIDDPEGADNEEADDPSALDEDAEAEAEAEGDEADETDDLAGDSEEGTEGSDEEDTDDEEDGDDYEEVAYSDDDEVEVTVDGETRVVSLRELKKAFSGEGAIEKRLKEATEARKEATSVREAALNEVTAHRAGLMQTIQQLDQVLFMPMVDEPDPNLRSTNINAYLMQKDAWEEDQKRIAKSRTDLQQFFVGQQQETAKAREAFRQEQIGLLVQNMPEIADPVKGPKLNREILDAAQHYGFTAEQVAQVDNHGLFLMARDAARWLNLQKLKKNGAPVPSGGEKLRRRKRLRSGTVSEVKARLVKSSKEQRATTEKAKSGKVDDVANMLISKARTVKGNDSGRRR